MFAVAAGGAAAIGGGLWVAKATAILATGDQPEYIFEIAPPFLALGLVGLHALLGGRGGWRARAGGILAWLGVVAGTITALVYVATTDDESGVLSVTFPVTMLSIVGALVLLGVAVRRARALPGRWRSLPLAHGVGLIPFGSPAGCSRRSTSGCSSSRSSRTPPPGSPWATPSRARRPAAIAADPRAAPV